MVTQNRVGQSNGATRTGERTLIFCYFCEVHSGFYFVFDLLFCGSVVLWFCGSVVLWFCGSVVLWFVAWWIILWKVMGTSRGMNNTMWRYGLTEDRSAAMSGRCRGEALRCAATRRLTSRTGVVSGSANWEKTGSFVVKIQNKWPVFQCTVNWSRARLS